MLVVDCAQIGDGTVEWMRENGIILEVGHETARRWGTINKGIKVEVMR